MCFFCVCIHFFLTSTVFDAWDCSEFCFPKKLNYVLLYFGLSKIRDRRKIVKRQSFNWEKILKLWIRNLGVYLCSQTLTPRSVLKYAIICSTTKREIPNERRCCWTWRFSIFYWPFRHWLVGRSNKERVLMAFHTETLCLCTFRMTDNKKCEK